MEWFTDNRYRGVYYTSKIFNGYQYKTEILVEHSDKTLKYWVSVSSGKKRRDLDIFESKESKSLGGLRALLWAKEAMYDFTNYYSYRVYDRKEYICIGWSDSRRRDIYQRLLKEGFVLTREWGKKILMKKL